MAKKIQIHGDIITNPVLKTGNRTFGVSLTEEPSSSVTVTFDSTNDYFTHTWCICNYTT